MENSIQLDKLFQGAHFRSKTYTLDEKIQLQMESAIIKRNSFRITDNIKEWIIYSMGIICACLFLFSAYEKLVEHERFLKGLSKAPVVGSFALYISWFVPVIEIIVSILLIVPHTSKWGLRAFTSVMILFTLYIMSMWLWVEKLPCNCNLIVEKLSWGQHIVFNMAFVAFAVFALWFMKGKTRKLKY